MSSSIKDNTITLTRGDTLRVKVDIFKDGDPYIPESEDSVRFAVKHKSMLGDKSDYTDTDPLINIQIPTDTLILTIEPEDTKDLGFGKYVYDVEITFSDGTVDTFITASPFILSEEVH